MTSPKESTAGIEGTLVTQESTESKPPTSPEPTDELFLNMEPLERIAAGEKLVIPRNPHFTRKDVVQAFHTSFELMGGIPRLALWGHEHPTEFYKLYSRLLPSQASSALGESNVLRLEMAVPPSPLDEAPPGVPRIDDNAQD